MGRVLGQPSAQVLALLGCQPTRIDTDDPLLSPQYRGVAPGQGNDVVIHFDGLLPTRANGDSPVWPVLSSRASWQS